MHLRTAKVARNMSKLCRLSSLGCRVFPTTMPSAVQTGALESSHLTALGMNNSTRMKKTTRNGTSSRRARRINKTSHGGKENRWVGESSERTSTEVTRHFGRHPTNDTSFIPADSEEPDGTFATSRSCPHLTLTVSQGVEQELSCFSS